MSWCPGQANQNFASLRKLAPSLRGGAFHLEFASSSPWTHQQWMDTSALDGLRGRFLRTGRYSAAGAGQDSIKGVKLNNR
jgi:hypothetical protein